MGRPSSGCGGGYIGAATQAVPQLGHPSNCLTPAARDSHRSRVLLPLLPPKTPLYVYRSLTVGSLHIVEPDCSADPGIWSDLHLWRSYRSEYSHGRYASIRGTSSRPHPSRFLQLEHTPPEVPPPPGLPASPLHRPPMGRASLLTLHQRTPALRAPAPQAPMPLALRSQAPPPQAPQMAPPLCQLLPSSGSQPATPYQQAVQLPVKPKGRGVTFDTPTDKVAAVGGQDADRHGRQKTHNRDNKTWPTSPGRGACKRSSVRMTDRQTPHQAPSGAARNAPRDSTPGSASQQDSSSTRALRDPLKWVSRFRSQGWKKDLERIFRAYYEYNFISLKEAGWNKIRDKVFDHLLPCQEEWRRIKENNPLQYMPYMEEQFYAATGIRLEGFAGCTVLIKCGSYYHSVVAQRGQLNKCPHLAGIEPPRGPQMMPSESRLVSQRKPDAPAISSGAPATEASAPQGATADVPAPMETGGAGDSHSWVERTEDEDDFKRCRPAKRPRSQSRKWENRPTYPFQLQDEEGRRNSAQEIYRHSGQQPPACHNVATMGITYLHLEVLLRDAWSLGNQVLCMIAEYHLVGHAQGSSSLSLVLLEAATELLPPLDRYTGGMGFRGMRVVRVVDRAKTL